MKKLIILLLISVLQFISEQNILAQEDINSIAKVKTINFGAREITFSNVEISGKKTNYLEVARGQEVSISVDMMSVKNGDYCPGCIVQVYWGIHGSSSICAKHFHGYSFPKFNSKDVFYAPMEDGIYYITTGIFYDYSCKNLKTRPFCSPEYAFAILKVGNPPKQKKQLKLLKEQRGPSFVLKLDFLNKSNTSSNEKLEWFLDGEKLNRYYNYKEIPILAYGTYKVMWYNCNETESITYKVTEKN